MVSRLSGLLALAMLASPALSQQADTSKRPPRPYGIAHAHLGMGGGRVPYLGDAIGGRTSEFRLGFAFNAFPQWTVALAANSMMNGGADYYVQACASRLGCKPNVRVSTDGLEVQRRWWNDRAIHPVATVSTGTLMTSYSYNNDLISDIVVDSVQTLRYVSVGAGIEGNAGRWIHGAVIAGYRATGGHTIPRATSSNTGPTLLWLVEIGRP
jgi:hypothetical protein